MSTSFIDRNFALLSTRRSAEEVELTVREVEIPRPDQPNDIIVQMLAAPINPSDIGTMLGTADPTTARRAEADAGDTFAARTVLQVPVGADLDPAMLGVSRPIGLEGSGRVVAAGAGPHAQLCSAGW